jgi:hypothetical protein
MSVNTKHIKSSSSAVRTKNSLKHLLAKTGAATSSWRVTSLVFLALLSCVQGTAGNARPDESREQLKSSTTQNINRRRGDVVESTGRDIAATVGEPSGYVRSGRVNTVVYRGSDNHIHEFSLPFDGATWTAGDLTAITGAATAAGDPVGYTRSDGINSVVYRGTDNHIHEIYLGGTRWATGDLTALTGAAGTAGIHPSIDASTTSAARPAR